MTAIDLPTITVTPISHTVARVAITFPDVQLAGDSWEILLPPPILASSGLANLTITGHGLYVEDHAGRYDFIPFSEFAMLLDDATVSPVVHHNGTQPH